MADHPSGCADRDGIRRQRLGHHRVGADDAPVADGDTRDDDHPGAQPDVRADTDVAFVLVLVHDGHTGRRPVVGRGDEDLGGEQRVFADVDTAGRVTGPQVAAFADLGTGADGDALPVANGDVGCQAHPGPHGQQAARPHVRVAVEVRDPQEVGIAQRVE